VKARPGAAGEDDAFHGFSLKTVVFKSSSRHNRLQQDAVGDSADHLLTTVPGHGVVFHIQHAGGDKLVNVFFDGAAVAFEALRQDGYRCRLFFNGSKKFNAGGTHNGEHIGRILEGEGVFRLKRFSLIYVACDFATPCKKVLNGAGCYDYVAHCIPPKPLSSLSRNAFQRLQSF